MLIRPLHFGTCNEIKHHVKTLVEAACSVCYTHNKWKAGKGKCVKGNSLHEENPLACYTHYTATPSTQITVGLDTHSLSFGLLLALEYYYYCAWHHQATLGSAKYVHTSSAMYSSVCASAVYYTMPTTMDIGHIEGN